MDDAALRSRLRTGERLLWTGAPDRAVHLTRHDWVFVPISLLWCGFVLVWEYLAVTSGAPVPFALFGLPFVCFGLYLAVGRFVVKARRKALTRYAVTSERAIVTVGETHWQEAPVRGTQVRLTRSRDGRHLEALIGTGDGPGRPFGMNQALYDNSGMEIFTRARPLGFFDVQDADGLVAALSEANRPA